MASEYPYMKRGRCIHEKTVSLVVCCKPSPFRAVVLTQTRYHSAKIRHIQNKPIQERSLYEFVNCQYANGEIVYWQFYKKYFICKERRKNNLTQEELRELYCKRLEREKQIYVAKATGINGAILSQFKRGKINLYPHLFSKLESYLMNP